MRPQRGTWKFRALPSSSSTSLDSRSNKHAHTSNMADNAEAQAPPPQIRRYGDLDDDDEVCV